jgi:thiamine phosphate synthase YjbQ (UPF0047 family)
MTVESQVVRIETQKEGEILDITDQVQAIVVNGIIKSGVAPRDGSYEHERRWHDRNGHSHVRASLIGPDLSVPFVEKKLMLGTRQQIVFIEFDVRPRDRTIIVNSMGE